MQKTMLNKQEVVLVIAPHQDDEVIGCGGAICQLVSHRYDVRVAHVFLGTSGIAGVAPEQSQHIRHEEARAAASIGGYTVLPNLKFIDRDRSQDAKIQKAILRLIRQVKPAIVFLPHKEETDYEHKLVAIEGREALWLAASDIYPSLGAPLTMVPRVFYYEVWKNLDTPTVLCDITKHKEVKRRMLEAFTSQMSSSGWVDGALGRNAYRGVTTFGDGLYEAFSTENVTLEELLS